MNADILVYSEFQSNRLSYILHQVIVVWWGLKYRLTNDMQEYLRYEGIRINYSNRKMADKELMIPANTLLADKTTQQLVLNQYNYNKIPALFSNNTPNTSIPFDLFATMFFHLSRYEEYLPFSPDLHGRFTYKESWAFQNGCLHLPIVDQLLQEMGKLLQSIYPRFTPPSRSFQMLPTYDIDMAWAYKHKGIQRHIGGFFRDLVYGKWSFLKDRFSVLTNKKQDPFQFFDQFEQWQPPNAMPPIYFFLLGDYGPFDKNIRPTNSAFRQLIKGIAQKYAVGIHPSYQSNLDIRILTKEIQRLEDISQQPITKSRQHFLKLHLPTTYQHLITKKITADYSMGYAGQIGFRAGTSLSFYWYDLQKEETTTLLIHPFQIMDVTLKEYLLLTPEEAKEKIRSMIQSIKAVNGTFCSLWHNSSFSSIDDWEGWEEVYRFLLSEGGG